MGVVAIPHGLCFAFIMQLSRYMYMYINVHVHCKSIWSCGARGSSHTSLIFTYDLVLAATLYIVKVLLLS